MEQFSINIEISEADKIAVLKGIDKLNNLPHVRSMPRSSIASASGLKETKVRLILPLLIDADEVTRYTITDNPNRQRYYFTLTDLGKEHMAQSIVEMPRD